MRTGKVPRAAVDETVRAAWERALALWGVRLNDPIVLPGAHAKAGAPAWFTFPPSVSIDPDYLAGRGLADELWSMLAHEVGHHVLAPSTRIDGLKVRHQMARALAAVSSRAPAASDIGLLANLWNDLLVNTRLAQLQRAEADAAGEPGIIRLGRVLYPAPAGSADRLWWVYCRAYEILWRLPAGTLCAIVAPPAPPPAVAHEQLPPLDTIAERHREKERILRERKAESARIAAELAGARTTNPVVDAALVADAVRTFGADPVPGAVRFGVIAAPYIAERQDAAREVPTVGGAGCAADEKGPSAEELGRILADQRLRGDLPAHPGAAEAVEPDDDASSQPGQRLDVARTLGLYSDLDQAEVLAAWYRTEAASRVRPYTRRAPAQPAGGLPGPLELWETGDAIGDIDWAATLRGGRVIPGVTTRRRSELDDDPVVRETSIEIDLYIDSSGSMRNPRAGSPAVLAGTILALSVLRGGGRVRVTSFSAAGQVAGMERASRDPAEIVGALCVFFGGGTSFPLDLYDSRYAALPRATEEVQRHVVVLSDDGLVSMFGVGNEPFAGVARAVSEKLTTGTLVLMDRLHRVSDLARRDGYDVVYLSSMDDAPAACAALAERLHG
ncbi:VWA domain-containing protein [Microbacterium galbinum]|uniref:VWA domain-containing protein n=1 Tax=Microbacterium galbinum TaxID=2851646 RepID=UPI001FFCF6FA|nr:VWA domain-containing protein [Microbacterium galbinum]MCK2030884.1 VWA domain-containing protein [Microbacterium galbinum]